MNPQGARTRVSATFRRKPTGGVVLWYAGPCRGRGPPAAPAHALPGPPRRVLVPPRPGPRPHAVGARHDPGTPAAPAAAPLRAEGHAAAALALGEGRPGQPGRQTARSLAGPPGVLATSPVRPRLSALTA